MKVESQLKSTIARYRMLIALGVLAWAVTSTQELVRATESDPVLMLNYLESRQLEARAYSPLKSETRTLPPSRPLNGDEKSRLILEKIVVAQNQEEQDKRSELLRAVNSYQQSGKFAEAEVALRTLVAKYPKDATLQYKLGKALFSQNKLEEAVAAFQQALRLNANYAVAHNGLGMALANQGRVDEAVASFQQALAINPGYADALSNLGRLLWHQNKRAEAQSTLEKALTVLKQQSRFQEVRQVEQLMQQIRNAPLEPV